MGWIYLACAIGFEIAGTMSTKLSQGLTVLLPSVALFGFYGTAMVFNAFAMKTIDMSVTYAIWSGVGTAAISLIGVVIFKEPATVLKFACIAMIIAGVIGLQLVSSRSLALPGV